MSRRIAREKALQALFAVEVGKSDRELVLENLLKKLRISDSEKIFSKELVDGVLTQKDKIDNLIAKYSKDWVIDRIGKVELCALRIAIYEMLYRDEIPPVVSIDEALEIVRRYASEDSVKFVNGILDSIFKENVKGE